MATLGCIKARMGDTEYYITKMPAGELVNSVGVAKEMPEWPDMTAEEKMQRECDIRRIVEEIVPYVIEDPDHFFSSLIVDIYSGFEDIRFESVEDAVNGIPAAYAVPMRGMGFITLPGSERLIALDGQHRLLSLRIAIKGIMGVPAGTKYSPSINALIPHPELAKDEVCVILVRHTDTAKIRKIFNKINKYAKQTSRSDNIITSDDDTFAVIARRLIKEDGPLAPIGKIELVNWKSNTLSQRSKNLTTLSALYTIAETILKDEGFSSKVLPSDEALEAAYQKIMQFWSVSLTKIQAFRDYLALTREDRPVSVLREENILLKPVTQMALAYTALIAQRKGIAWENVADKLNQIDWSYTNDLWFNILVIGSANKKMITGKDSIRSAGAVISYLIMGADLSKSELDEVRRIIRNARNDESAKLPPMIR
ncbi:MAG: DGQHR domain-containing protein [Acidaminococcaceae bacterium]|nr:DGQHR domain-containing protein [Acidaminococcaceae bacterium]